MRIQYSPVNADSQVASLKKTIGAEKDDKSFANSLKDAISDVNDLQNEADTLAVKAATGDMDNLHQVTIAMEKAVLALEFAVQVRNKAIEAYQELMRTQV